MVDEEGKLRDLTERQVDMLDIAGLGRTNTATFYVSPDGSGADGLSWRTAYQTIPAAIAAASSDANALTRLLLAPGTYDMDTTGDPDFAKNIVLQGSHRNWVIIENNHASATTVVGNQSYLALFDLTVDCGTGDNNGIAAAVANGFRAERVYIEAEHVTGAQTGIYLLGGAEYARIKDVKVHGVKAHTTGIRYNNCALSLMDKVDFVDCLTGLKIDNAASDGNIFTFIAFANCTLGLDVNGGNNQFFHELMFANCTRDIDDEVGDHTWVNIHGSHPVYVHPDNFTGDIVNTNAVADTWGTDTEIIAAAAIDNPFRVVAIQAEGSANEKFRIRFSSDSGGTHYDDIQIEGSVAAVSRETSVFPSQSVPIYNVGTRISCSTKSESGGNNVWVWVEIQEL